MLRDETRKRIIERVSGLFARIDPEVHVIDAVLDSTRTQLAFMLQKGDWPVVLGMEWLDFVSRRDDDLLAPLSERLKERLEAAQKPPAREAD